MKRIFTALAVLPLLLAAIAELNAAETRRPNLLFILTDDQSAFDFRFYNPRPPSIRRTSTARLPAA
jgi:hypothetical protein